jgi:uncharacterized protein
MLRRLLPLIGLLLLLVGSSGRASAKDVPPLTGRVVDQANLLTAEQRQRIETQLAALEKQTGDQVAVLTVDTLDGDPIEDFANKTGRAWALGQKGKNNGVILLVAKQDRKMRIEVGYGLEPELTDLQTNIIQTQIIIPHFKQGDFGGGIEAGVDALVTTLQGKPLAAPAAEEPQGNGGGSQSWPGFLIFGLFALGPFILNAIRSGSWIVYVVVLPILFFLGSIVSTVVGLVAAGVWLVLFPVLRMVLPRTPTSGRFGRGTGGGWWMGGPGGWGGGGGRGGWGGGGGGGGFSGGGGSFGGGGSSSSW